MKKVILLIMTVLMISAVANADTTDRGRKHKKMKKMSYSSQHGWKYCSTRRTCNKKRRH